MGECGGVSFRAAVSTWEVPDEEAEALGRWGEDSEQ